MKKAQTLLLGVVVLVGSLCAGEEAERKTIRTAEPEFPEIARKMAIHGSVKLKLWIDPDGTVSRVEYITGHPMMSFAAITAVKKWKYANAEKESTTVVEVKF